MPSPFPGMDPFLESPRLWPDLHNALIAAIRSELGPKLRPRYVVCIEERTYLAEPEELVFVGLPDLTVQERRDRTADPDASATLDPEVGLLVDIPVPEQRHETYLEVSDVSSGQVVTVLEILSPANKLSAGEGRDRYLQKRSRVLSSLTNLVEIDLLRAGRPIARGRAMPASDYRILISRGDTRPSARVLAFNLRDPIPTFPLPLRRGDVLPQVAIGPLLARIYDEAGCDLRADYKTVPPPPLRDEDAAWAQALLASAGLGG